MPYVKTYFLLGDLLYNYRTTFHFRPRSCLDANNPDCQTTIATVVTRAQLTALSKKIERILITILRISITHQSTGNRLGTVPERRKHSTVTTDKIRTHAHTRFAKLKISILPKTKKFRFRTRILFN